MDNELQESGAKKTLVVAVWIVIIAMIIIAIAVVVWRGQNGVVEDGEEQVSLEDIENEQLRALEELRRAREESGVPTLTEEEQLKALEELRRAREESGVPTLTEEEQLKALEELRNTSEE